MSSMVKTIAVCGATGNQGGAVAQALLQKGEWKVRGITRHKDSAAAKGLIAAGAEIVVADLDDEESLVKAFEGVQAIYAVTNFWEMMSVKGSDEAGLHEQKQSVNLASAASKTLTLKHYIFSTLPSTMEFSNGKHKVPHMEYKAEVDKHIIKNLPDLAKLTTFLWIGWYPSNMASMPLIKLTPIPMSGKYAWIQPSPAEALLPIGGDIGVNVGVFVAAILAHPEITQPARYITVKTETVTFQQILDVWCHVTGKEAVYIEIPFDDFVKLWGPYGTEMGLQFNFGKDYGDWDTFKPDMIKPEEIGIKRGDLKGLEETLKAVKSNLI